VRAAELQWSDREEVGRLAGVCDVRRDRQECSTMNMNVTQCTCPHTATREGLIRNGRDIKCPVHGDPVPMSAIEKEPLPDGMVQEMLTNCRTINRLHKQDVRWDMTIARDRNGKTMYDYMEEALEENVRNRAIARAILEKMQS
jgi:hypothetical protein